MDSLLNLVCAAAKEAGKAIMQIYQSGDYSVSTKSDHSPLTQADQAAHEIIVRHLTKTGLPVLSEEGAAIPYDERVQWKKFWLVDPLDGTKEFINRNGEFTVNIALIIDGSPVAGVIYAPCLDLLYFGSKELGAYKVKNGTSQLLPRKQMPESLELLEGKEQVTVVASKSHLNPATREFIDRFNKPVLTTMGSSLKLMLVAEGAADLYPRLAPTMEWDTAAGHALLLATGSNIFQDDLKTELTYNKESLVNPSFIAI